MRCGIFLLGLFFRILVFAQGGMDQDVKSFTKDSLTQSRIDSVKAAGTKNGMIQSPEPDSATVSKPKKPKKIDTAYYSPKKAALLALACPGLGQIYNKKYWKLPIVYGMMGGAIYFVTAQSIKLREYNGYITLRESGGQDPFFNSLSIEELVDERNYYRRNVQLASFATMFVWGLSIVDATVDAHMRAFDVSDNLSLQVKPKIGVTQQDMLYAGLNINFKLK
jgi:hypothetical protein